MSFVYQVKCIFTKVLFSCVLVYSFVCDRHFSKTEMGHVQYTYKYKYKYWCQTVQV